MLSNVFRDDLGLDESKLNVDCIYTSFLEPFRLFVQSQLNSNVKIYAYRLHISDFQNKLKTILGDSFNDFLADITYYEYSEDIENMFYIKVCSDSGLNVHVLFYNYVDSWRNRIGDIFVIKFNLPNNVSNPVEFVDMFMHKIYIFLNHCYYYVTRISYHGLYKCAFLDWMNMHEPKSILVNYELEDEDDYPPYYDNLKKNDKLNKNGIYFDLDGNNEYLFSKDKYTLDIRKSVVKSVILDNDWLIKDIFAGVRDIKITTSFGDESDFNFSGYVGTINVCSGSDKLLIIKAYNDSQKSSIFIYGSFGRDYDKDKMSRLCYAISMFARIDGIPVRGEVEHIEDEKRRKEIQEIRRKKKEEEMARWKDREERRAIEEFEKRIRRQQMIDDNDAYGYEDVYDAFD